MKTGLDHLIAVLQPERVGDDHYRGLPSSNDGVDATYGGHFLGQATAAAVATVEGDRRIHSLHAYFLRAGTPGEPFDLHVERVRDGRTFCTRRVRTSQGGGKTQLELIASFSKPEDGGELVAEPPPDFAELPEPESLPDYRTLLGEQDPMPLPEEWVFADHGIDVRVVNAPWAPRGMSPAGGIRSWMRAFGPVPDDPGLHAAMLAFQSDESISDNVAWAFGITWGVTGDQHSTFVSLDHAMWFHRPFRFDEWLFVEQFPVTAAHSRGVATGRVWNRSGDLVASFTQEALIRAAS